MIQILRTTLLGALLLLPLASVWATATPQDTELAAAAAHRKAEHERIRHEREVLAAGRQKDEAACYQRFAVEDCLREVRARVRGATDRLRTQEVELNDAERREKAAERLRTIEERNKPVPPAGKGADPTLRKAPVDPQAAKAQRGHEAEQRAQQQRSRIQQQDSEHAQRAAASADRAAKARARHAETLKVAEERRARVEKSQADAAEQGRKPAAPLPTR